MKLRKNPFAAIVRSAFPLIVLFGLCVQVMADTDTAEPTKIARGKRLAVLDFEGQQGKEFSMELESMLASLSINNVKLFQVYSRSAVEKAIKEIEFGNTTGLVDSSTAAKLGKFIGAEAVFTGKVSEATVRKEPVQMQMKTCVEQNGRKCERWQTRDVRCMRVSATFRAVPSLLDVKTAQIIYSKISEGNVREDFCEGYSNSRETELVLLKKARDDALYVMQKDIAPGSIDRFKGFKDIWKSLLR